MSEIIFMDQDEVAARWGVSPRTLERWRHFKRGPRYIKIGARVLYRLTDIETYEVQRSRAGIPESEPDQRPATEA